MPHLFDPKNIERLEDPERTDFQNPSVVLDLMAFNLGGGFLDFGSGSGYFTFPAYDRFSDHGPFYAADIQTEMIQIFKKKSLEKYGKEPISPLVIQDHKIPLPEMAIENVLMVNVFHELDNPKSVLAEIFRILKAGGSLFVVDWKKEKTPKGPPPEERADEVDIYDDLLSAGFMKIRSWDVYSWHIVVQAIR